MRIKLLFVAVLVLLCSSPYLRSNVNKAKAYNDYYVQNLDTGIYYISIQEAINAPETLDGHTILLDLHIYEEHIVINKSVKLYGAINLGLPSPPYPDITTIKGNGTGTIVTIRAPNVTLHSLKIMNGTNGIVLEEAHDSILWWVTICDNTDNGLYFLGSRNCTLKYTHIINNRYNFGVEGLELEDYLHTIISCTINAKPIYYLINEHEVSLTEDSGYIAAINCTTITVQNQNLTNNRQGILLVYTKNSTIRNTNINKNLYGIYIQNSENNIIYHNNFVNNTYQVKLEVTGNSWNDDVEGNFWNNYTGIDVNHDGIGDTPHVLDDNNQDNHPLMGMFSEFSVVHQGETYHVTTICNSTISTFQCDNVAKEISFNVSGSDGSLGFCRVTIPNIIVQDFWQGSYTVLVDGEEPWAIGNWTYGTNTYIHLIYLHSEHQVSIVPEFSLFLILPLFMTATLLAVIVYKRNYH
jgi:parallel beta-helix repeat protein